jgi:hypothetical protein
MSQIAKELQYISAWLESLKKQNHKFSFQGTGGEGRYDRLNF